MMADNDIKENNTKPEAVTVQVKYDDLVMMMKYVTDAQHPQVTFSKDMENMKVQAKDVIDASLAKLWIKLNSYIGDKFIR